MARRRVGAVPQEHVARLQVAMDDTARDAAERMLQGVARDMNFRAVMEGAVEVLQLVADGASRPDYATDPVGWRRWADENVACAAGNAAGRRCYLPRVDGSDCCAEHGR